MTFGLDTGLNRLSNHFERVFEQNGRNVFMILTMKISQSIQTLFGILLLCLVTTAAQAVSLEEEIKLGQEEHRKMIAQFGVYRDKELQAYVDMVGQRVAKESSRPELEYTFTILNDEMINALGIGTGGGIGSRDCPCD